MKSFNERIDDKNNIIKYFLKTWIGKVIETSSNKSSFSCI